MNEQSFKANDWLEPIYSKNSWESRNDSQLSEPKLALPIALLQPGWKGDALFSKSAASLKLGSEILWKNSLKLFSTFKNSNNNLKNLILNEFNIYVRERELKNLKFNSTSDFWVELFPEGPIPRKEEINSFVNIYCYRAVITYIYRIQFIASLSKALGIKTTENNYINPNGFLSKIFQQGGPRELSCESLRTNSYSWFRPDPIHQDLIVNFVREIENVGTIEFLKIFSHHPEIDESPEFSHSLSNKTFGEFLNLLITQFPTWILNGKDQNRTTYLNTKFTGDFLCSITNSFWLGQNGFSSLNSSYIIPDFVGEGKEEGNFLKICQELLFLTHLSNLSVKIGKDPTLFICQTFKQKFAKTSEVNSGQMNLCLNEGAKKEIFYDRIVLNFFKTPKKNPHHFLANLINSQKNILNKDGFLFVFSNQNLFVSSQTERVQDILNTFKLEAFFSFEKLKGKGEITSFLYVLRKRANKDAVISKLQEKKESFFSFRWSGNLSSIYNFNLFNKELNYFLNNRNPFSNALYHKELSTDLNFEFLNDAVLDGVLLHSSSNDTSKVTHPNFFKNLTKYCIPFDNFFKIESINPNEGMGNLKDDLTLELLGKKVTTEDKFQFILIVNLTDVTNIKIEIVPSTSYIAKINENGFACFQYYGLIPKKFNLSINLFREYFQTDLGQQIIQLFLDSSTKLKSKIRSLLVPKFFLPEFDSSLETYKKFQIFELEKDQLINSHPHALLNDFENFKHHLEELVKTNPLKTLETLTNFKLNLEMVLSWIFKQNGPNQNIKYTNPIIKESISKLKLYPIYPSNKEIHIEVVSTSKDDLNGALSHTSLKLKESINILEIFTSKGLLLEIYSDHEILQFFQFLLSFKIGVPVTKIISSLSLPRIDDLKIALSNFEDIQKTFNYLLLESKKIITNIFMQKISSFNKGVIH